MTLTDRLDSLMKARKIKNKKELADLSGVPYTTIMGIYKNGSDNVTLRTLRKLCNFFGCSLDYLALGVKIRPLDDPTFRDLFNAAEGNDKQDIQLAIRFLERTKDNKILINHLLAFYEENGGGTLEYYLKREAQNVHPDTEKR